MSFSSISSYAASGAGRAWQGCATDGTNVWLISDRSTQSAPWTLSNNIDTFTVGGALTTTDTGIYTATVGGLMWNFVDGYYNPTDGYLYVCCTNYHSYNEANGSYLETAAQILVLDPSDWSVVTTHSLTTHAGSIESIAKRGSEWWVAWSGSQSIRRYNSDFSTLIGTYSVPLPSGVTPYGHSTVQWWQGIDWHGDVLLANLHGANTAVEATYAPGLVEAWWNGTSFQAIRAHTPPTYGSGQGICRIPDTNTLYFADRVENDLVKSTLVGAGIFEFNGTTGGVTVSSDAAVDDLASGAYTVSAWITPDTTGENGTGRIADKRNITGGGGGWLFFTDGTASLGFQCTSSDSAALANNRGAANSITLGVRQHVLLTYNNAGDRKGHIYVGGSEISYATNTAASDTVGSDAAGTLFIGKDYSETRVFDGLIEEFAIWNSVLSSGDIAALVAGNRPDTVGTPVLYAPNLDAVGVTGTISATESGSDVAALSGVIRVSGSINASESGSDSASLAGDVHVSGSLSVSEAGADVASIIGGLVTPAITGSITASETGSDTANLVGDVIVSGVLSVSEAGADTAFINGSSAIITTGAMSASESGSDGYAITGKVYLAGELSAVEGGLDGFAVSGNIYVSGVVSASESGSDTALIDGRTPGTGTLTPETIAAIADAVWDHEIETGYTARQMMKIMFAALAGKREGIGTPVEYYYDVPTGTIPRITFTPDAQGNGTPVVDGA